MRAVAYLLALLAVLKVGYHQHLYRSATGDVIVTAYRDRAIEACRRDAKNHTLGLGAQAWSSPQSVKLVIGKTDLGVYVWQVDHALWNARFRNPYLFITADQRNGRVLCEFDIVHGAAAIHRL
jgi:hypothetical protein